MSKNLRNGCVKIGDTDMYYAAFGTGPKRLAVLPGLSDGFATVDGKAWLLGAPYKKFFKDYTVYMFSRKNKMSEGYSIRDMAADQVLAMKELGMEKASVLGVSQGGMVAQFVAIDHPEIVERLILTVTAPYANEVVKDAVGDWIEMAKRDDYLKLMEDTANKMYSDAFLKKNKLMLPLVARLTKPKSYDRFYINAHAILNFDARQFLNKISAPTLIIAGDNDKTVGNDGPKEMSAAIPNNEVYIYKGLGHGVHEEAKDFYDRVYEFCEKGIQSV